MADGFASSDGMARRGRAAARLPFLVTGGCGFIGAGLTAALAARGEAVRVLDDLSNGSISLLPPGVEFLQGDIADPAVVRRAMQGVAGCFHLAGFASVPQSQRQWLNAHRINLTGAVNVLDASHRERPANPVPVVYASTAAIYGDHESMLLAEWLPAKPISSYGADSVGAELHARIARAVHGVPAIGMRLFNVYGPRQSAQANYASAKAGLIGLTKTVARELASRGITANAIAPGLIETELTADLPDAARQFVLDSTPLGYIGSVEDVAAAAVYLASDEARYVTGQVLGVDGGMMMGG